MSWFKTKIWKNKGQEGYNRSNSVNNADNLNDFEKRISEAFDVKIVTDANTDLNNYKETGIYFFPTTLAPTNRPPAVVNGWLFVFKGDGEFIKQIWYRAGTSNTNDHETYVRTYTSTWSGWHQYLVDIRSDITVTMKSGYTKENRSYFVSRNNNYNFCLMATSANAIPQSFTTIATISTNHTPLQDLFFVSYGDNGSGGSPGTVLGRITTSGNVDILALSSGIKRVQISMNWIK